MSNAINQDLQRQRPGVTAYNLINSAGLSAQAAMKVVKNPVTTYAPSAKQ